MLVQKATYLNKMQDARCRMQDACPRIIKIKNLKNFPLTLFLSP
jgi:hypothetical protein